MLVPIEVVAGIVGLVSLCFSVALMLSRDKINHLRELMRLRMTEGGKIRVTLEEQVAIELALRPPVSKAGDRDYVKRNAALLLPSRDLVAIQHTHDYRTQRTN